MKKLLFILCAVPLFSHAGVIVHGGLAGVTGVDSKAESIANGKDSFAGDEPPDR